MRPPVFETGSTAWKATIGHQKALIAFDRIVDAEATVHSYNLNEAIWCPIFEISIG